MIIFCWLIAAISTVHGATYTVIRETGRCPCVNSNGVETTRCQKLHRTPAAQQTEEFLRAECDRMGEACQGFDPHFARIHIPYATPESQSCPSSYNFVYTPANAGDIVGCAGGGYTGLCFKKDPPPATYTAIRETGRCPCVNSNGVETTRCQKLHRTPASEQTEEFLRAQCDRMGPACQGYDPHFARIHIPYATPDSQSCPSSYDFVYTPANAGDIVGCAGGGYTGMCMRKDPPPPPPATYTALRETGRCPCVNSNGVETTRCQKLHRTPAAEQTEEFLRAECDRMGEACQGYDPHFARIHIPYATADSQSCPSSYNFVYTPANAGDIVGCAGGGYTGMCMKKDNVGGNSNDVASLARTNEALRQALKSLSD